MARSSPDNHRHLHRPGADAVADYSADPTGLTNSTAALKSFYEHCITTGIDGHIPDGTYLITLGQLSFDNGHVDTAFPNITTGSEVIFKAAVNIDAPFLSFSNGTAVSGAGRFWQFGYHGGVKFIPAVGSVAAMPNMNGLQLVGLNFTQFGPMRARGIGGSTVALPRALFGGNNPDPYHVNGCNFELVEGLFNTGKAFFNDNYVGMTGCVIRQLYAIGNKGGGYWGYGAANTVEDATIDCSGWAFGENSDALGGASSRFTLEKAELDTVELGINAGRLIDSKFKQTRIVHRMVGNAYWPISAIDIASSGACSQLRFDIIDRIEAGGSLADLGAFADFNNAGGNATDITIRRNVINNAGLALTNAYLYSNLNTNSTIGYTDALGAPVIDLNNKVTITARAPTTGYQVTSSLAVVQFSAVIGDRPGWYDPTTYTIMVKAPGFYRIYAQIMLALDVGDRVSMEILVNGVAVTGKRQAADDTITLPYNIEFVGQFAYGDAITIRAAQNSGSDVNLSTFSNSNDNLLSFFAVG